MGKMATRAIWAAGDEWRRLTEEVTAEGGATIISVKGTTRLVDSVRRRQMRLPKPGGRPLFGDLEWMPYATLEVTPCGVVIWHPQWWARGARVALVLPGLRPDWADGAAGQELVSVVRLGVQAMRGHPDEPCGATRCVVSKPAV